MLVLVDILRYVCINFDFNIYAFKCVILFKKEIIWLKPKHCVTFVHKHHDKFARVYRTVNYVIFRFDTYFYGKYVHITNKNLFQPIQQVNTNNKTLQKTLVCFVIDIRGLAIDISIDHRLLLSSDRYF